MLYNFTITIFISTKKIRIMMKIWKKKLKNELDPKQFKMTDEKNKIVELPEWLKSKNYFNKAVKLINDVRPDINNVKLSSDKK